MADFYSVFLQQLATSVLIGMLFAVTLFDVLGAQTLGEWIVFLLGCAAAGSILNVLVDIAMQARFAARRKEVRNANPN